jgi:hypothetical protein
VAEGPWSVSKRVLCERLIFGHAADNWLGDIFSPALFCGRKETTRLPEIGSYFFAGASFFGLAMFL